MAILLSDGNFIEWWQFYWVMAILLSDGNLIEGWQFDWAMAVLLSDGNFIEWWQFHWAMAVLLSGGNLIEWWQFHWAMAVLLSDGNLIEWWQWWQFDWVMAISLSDDSFIEWWRRNGMNCLAVVVRCRVGSHTLKSIKFISALLVFCPLRNLWKLPTRSLISWCACTRVMDTRTQHMCKQVTCREWIVCNKWRVIAANNIRATKAPTNTERAFLSVRRKYLRRPLRRCETCRHQRHGCLFFEMCVQALGL